ncbi:hypothetical protein CFN78_10760 [Amycolatopsis antarctica]|uniref:Uncharacterized protein n=1 Tax=Amycolatopsis antarctica TaxID=1854586 RepID=A0A263D4D7_9PSEU|nr:hypothetical protein [Amycolatopsis antarctica]OZM73323.1 hypothetical protein CFN78_10760 [Amycolatopsis antarctica]
MSIWMILGLLLVLGLAVAAIVDLRDHKRGGHKVPLPSRADLHADALLTHNQPTTVAQAFSFTP